jgi:hypothetical protein
MQIQMGQEITPEDIMMHRMAVNRVTIDQQGHNHQVPVAPVRVIKGVSRDSIPGDFPFLSALQATARSVSTPQ